MLDRADVDTDQIIPARFLTTTTRDGLGKSLFADWRYNDDGSENPNFELNLASNKDASVLVAGDNFGCGSSREHAPWALTDYGFKVVISSKIADIFLSNSLKNGLLPIVVDKATHALLLVGQCDVEVDLPNNELRVMQAGVSVHSFTFEIDNFSRYCLLNNTDQLGFILERVEKIEQFEQRANS